MQDGFKIVKYGTKIVTTSGSIKAIITAACIRDKNVSYEISYFQNGISTQCWVHRIEFEIDDSEKQSPGLVNYNNKSENLLIE